MKSASEIIFDVLTDVSGSYDNTTEPYLSALGLAGAKNRVIVFRNLLKSGTPNPTSILEKSTTLMAIAFAGHYEAVDLLLGFGAEIEAKDYQGRTALLHAISGNKDKTVQKLLELGAEANIIS